MVNRPLPHNAVSCGFCLSLTSELCHSARSRSCFLAFTSTHTPPLGFLQKKIKGVFCGLLYYYHLSPIQWIQNVFHVILKTRVEELWKLMEFRTVKLQLYTIENYRSKKEKFIAERILNKLTIIDGLSGN